MLTIPFHLTINHFAGKKAQNFSIENLKEAQLTILRRILKNSSTTEWGKKKGFHQQMNYDEFSKSISLTSWTDWEPLISKQRETGKSLISTEVQNYQPTSGSTYQRKWIPYTKDFLNELNQALSVWIHEIYTQFPGTRKGKHYWSLSWLPEDLRQITTNDDLKLLGKFQEILFRPIMAVPSKVQNTSTIEESTLLTLTHLVNSKDLSFISIWSPTFLLSLLHHLDINRVAISKRAESKRVKNLLLSKLPIDKLSKKLWPNLALISCWDSAESKIWAEKIKSIFPSVPLQGKGLLATEGIVTIPYQGHHALAYQSHFFEFLYQENIIPSWELKSGMIVEPILTTGSGLLRYHLPDKLEVTGFINEIPTLKFLGRMGGVDMTGEKLDREMIRHYFKELRLLNNEILPVTLLAVENVNNRPGYILILKKLLPGINYEDSLLKIHHYRLARELQQLAPLQVIEIENDQKFWTNLAKERSIIEGDQKADILIKVNKWS